jgi:flagellar biosynthetic protein FliO
MAASLAQLEPSFSQTEGFGGMLLRSLIVLIGVCLLAYLVIRVGLKRWAKRAGAAKGESRLHMLARLPIDAQRSVAIIQAGKRVFLVGVGEGQIALLAELDAQEWLAAESAPQPAAFGAILKARMGARDNENEP